MTAKKLCITLATVACLFLLSALSFFGSAEETPSLEEHYELSHDSQAAVYGAADLYRLAFDEEPTGVLLEYLTYVSGARFYVSDSVTANVRASFSEDVLTVEALAYTYQAKNGKTVTFLPQAFHFCGEDIAFESTDGTKYTVRKECSAVQASGELYVTYTAEFDVSDAVLEELLNGAFKMGISLFDAQTAYENALSEYEAAERRFQSYQADLSRYYEQQARYEQYLKDKNLYDRECASYREYLTKKEAYDAMLARYELYEESLADYERKLKEYNDYTAALEVYTQNIKKYREVSEQRAYEIAKLDVINSAYYTTELCFSMYQTLIGENVQLVVSQKETILSYAGDWDGLPQAIDAADASSKKLVVILREYRGLSSVEDQYAYYAAHYQELKDNFCLLYSSLDHLFDNAVVQTTLKKNDRYERYKEFLGQLFVLSTCFDDSVTLDTSVVIADGDRVCDLIVDGRLIVDNNHKKPSLTALPSEMEQPKKPDSVAKPEKPKAVSHPGDAPPVKNEPTMPTPVEAPTMPEEVLQPTPPIALQRNLLEERLYQAVKTGALKKRTSTADEGFSIASRISIVASIPERITVSYYDSDRKTLLCVTRIEEGQGAFYEGEMPDKPSDSYAEYDFLGFFDERGNKIEQGTVFSTDTCLYARYSQTPISYTVSFSVDGKIYSADYAYGEMPEVPSDTAKKSDERFHYVFDGWDAAVSYVTGDADYVATYRKIERMYKISFVARGIVLAQALLPYGAMPEFDTATLDKQVTDRYVESFSRWTPVLAAVTGDATYTAVYRQVNFGYDGHNLPLYAILQENGIIQIVNSTSLFSNGALFEYVSESKSDLTLSFPTGDIFIPYENARMLAESKALSVSLTGNGDKRKLSVGLKDATQTIDAYFEVTLDVSSYLRDDAIFHIYELQSDGTKKNLFFTVNEGKVKLDLRANTEILLANEFHIGVVVGGGSTGSSEDKKPTEGAGGGSSSVTPPTAEEPSQGADGKDFSADENISASPTQNSSGSLEGASDGLNEPDIPEGDTVLSMEGGSISLNCETAVAGDLITITAYPLYGYYLKSLSVMMKTADGNEEILPLQGMTFIMPNAPVTVNAEFALRTYVLRYLDDDGTLLFEKVLTFFDEEPTIDAPAGDDFRAFDRWLKEGTLEDGTVTYTATYCEIVYADPETSYQQDYGGWRFRDYIPHAALAFGAIGAAIALILVLKKKHRKKT